MLAIILIGLSISLLVVCAFVALAFFEVALVERPASCEASRARLARSNEFLAWATELARAVVSRQPDGSRSSQSVKRLVAEISEESIYAVAQLANEAGPSVPDCPSCHQRMIGVTPPEAVVIADRIRRTRSKRETQRIHDRAVRNTKITSGMDHEQYERTGVVCPLFEGDASCSVFDARPIRCRGWCLNADKEGDVRLISVSGLTPSGSRDRETGRSTEESHSRRLASVGLDAPVYELNSALATVLDSSAVTERWASGEPVFAQCKRYE